VSEKPLAELAISVERLIGWDRREKLRQLLDESLVDWDNARELVRRIQRALPLLEEMRGNCVNFDEGNEFRNELDRVIATLTGANEESKSDE
jgi:hypothetical protein